MPTAPSISVKPAATAVTSLPPAIRREAFYLDSGGQALFAWLHRSEQLLPGHAVVICPPLHHEQIHSHRSLRHLADALAALGFAVVRFDYHGSGDSAGSDEDPGRLAAWLASVRDAARWARQHLGAAHLHLIGVRLGAALATQIAVEQPVDTLVLWAPVVKGKAYAREMKALSLTAGAGAATGGAGYIESAGFVLTDETARALARVDLLQMRPQCRRALLVARDDVPADDQLLSHLKSLGIAAEQTTQPGYADMMLVPHETRVPHAAIAHLAGWLRCGVAAQPVAAADVSPGATAALIGHGATQLRERATVIRQDPCLFGILSEPTRAVPTERPLIVVINGGAAYRAGPNRLYVPLVRQLAAAGFRCLRLDLSGLGDSVCGAAAEENDCYAATAFRDIDHAFRFAQTELDAPRIVLMGLCSGAYFAFQAAAQFAGPPLVESVLINPLTYFWADGMQIGQSTSMKIKVFDECLESALQPSKWLKLITGRSKLGFRGTLQVLLDRWKLRRLPVRSGAPATDAGSPSHPAREDLPGDLQRIARSGRHLACFFSRADPGYPLLMMYAADRVEELRQQGVLSTHFIDNADHTFSQRATRDALREALAEHFCQRYV